ncbi:MAG: hypothetical protein ABFR90_03155 [Planctomycetota bacterium]
MDTKSCQSPRVDPVDGIIAAVLVEVHAVVVADGVGLHEAAEVGGVHAGAVIIQAPTVRRRGGGFGINPAGREPLWLKHPA